MSPSQQAAILQARTRPPICVNPTLHRAGGSWVCIWFEPEQPPQSRWRGQIVKEVVADKDVLELTGLTRWRVWWSGSEFEGRTRRSVLAQLQAEVATT